MARGFSYTGGSIYTARYRSSYGRGHLIINSVSFNEETGDITINYTGGIDYSSTGWKFGALAVYFNNYCGSKHSGRINAYVNAYRDYLSNQSITFNQSSIGNSLQYGIKTQWEHTVESSHASGDSDPGIGFTNGSSYIKETYSNFTFVYPQYDIEYNLNGGVAEIDTQIKDYRVDLVLSSIIPTRTNYNFIGWNTVQDGSGTWYDPEDTYSTDESVILYAQWELAGHNLYLRGKLDDEYSMSINTYGTVDLILNGTERYNNPTQYNEFLPYGTNFEFTNIHADPGRTYLGISAGTKTGTITEYDEFLELAFESNLYYINYDANQGEDAPEQQSYRYTLDTEYIQLSSQIPTRELYDFVSWNTAQDGSGDIYNPGDLYSRGNIGNVTLYAQWRESKPTNLTISGIASSGYTIKLTYNADAENATYTIYCNNRVIYAGSDKSLIINNLTPLTFYDIYFTCTNRGGTTTSNHIIIKTLSNRGKIKILVNGQWIPGYSYYIDEEEWYITLDIKVKEDNIWQ